MMKVTRSILALGCLAIMLVSCGGISYVDAIKLAKEAAAQLPSPPRIYNQYVYNTAYSNTADMRLWPDEPGSRQFQYGVCGAQPIEPDLAATCKVPMTLTTSLVSANGGQDVTFASSWLGEKLKHSWLLHVSGDGKVDFIREEGDKLPRMPQ